MITTNQNQVLNILTVELNVHEYDYLGFSLYPYISKE